ncbi:MAG: hypothetical protein KF901_31210, partial [Myxococcales bacterium]|nr:hypothetical protein [Myxococcales bacterium]
MSPDDDDLDFDLESALDAWEQDFEDHAQAEAAPMPQEAAPKPASPPRPAAAPAPPRAAGRPLYRPDPELLERAPSSRQAARPAAPARPAPAPAAPVKPAPTAPDPTSFASFDDDDDEADSTRIAAIPQELIASLQAVAAARDARDANAGPRPAEPPPSTSSPSPPRGIDLDLDDLFDDLETRNGGEPALPAPTPAAGTPSALALTGQLTDLAAPAAPAAPELAGPELAGPDLADEVHDPFSAERSVDDEDDEALVLPEHAPRSKPPSAPAPAPAKRAEEDDAKAPPRPMPATPRMPPVPRPAAGWKPPAPPALFAKGPVAPRAETPRAESSAAPGQGGADHAAGSQPASADGAHERETPIPRAAEDLARPFADLELDDLAPTTASIEPDDDLVFSVDSGARVDEPRAPALTAPAADLSRDEPNLPAKDESEHSPEADREEPARSLGPNDDEPDLSLGPDDDDDPGLSLGPNDDEPALSLGADDDDEPGLSLGSDEDQDDDEPDLSLGPDDDEPDLSLGPDDEPDLSLGPDDDEPDLSLGPDDDAPSHRGPVAPATTQDRGAAAASRTVRHRKPRDERFPYVGRDAETARRRAALLLELADRREGVSRARLASAAAELFERVGATEDAQSAYTQALDADPRDVVALRALRRDALHREDYGRAAELLELEVALPLSESDRAAAALLLAELQITHLGDPAAAERSARTAYDAAPSVAAGLLLVEACVVQGRALEAFVAWQKLAERWADPNVRATIWTSLARTAERGAQRPRAEKLYALAAAEHPSAVAPWLGLARLRTGRPRAEALASLASLLDSPPLAEAFRRAAATHLVREEPAAALALVDGAVRAASLRTRARAARLAGDAEALIAALEALAAASGGTERALALVDLAEARAARGDLEGADVALRDAALADEGLDTVRVVREVLARRAGDPARLAQSVATPDDLSTLSAVAQVAHAKDLARERELLATARDRGEAPLTADLVILDAAAEAGDDDAVADALRRAAERRTPERRAGPMLALAALLGEGTEPARGPLEAAVEAHPHPVTLAALARNVGLADPRRASELWELLAADLRGDAAYHAWTMAGRLARAASDLGAARGAFERASDELPGPTPAVWALEADAADVPEARALVHERVAATAPNPRIAVEAAVAAAITRGDGESFARVLEQTDALGLSDPALDAAIANIPGFDPATSAARAESLAARAEAPGARRYYQMRAALAHELAGDARAAAVAYRAVTEATPDPIALASLDRVELLAGEHARVADRRFEAVRDASDPAARVAALEALARFDRVERDDLGSAVLTLRTIREEAPGHLPTLRALARYDMSNAMDDELLSVASALSEQLPLPSALPEAVAASRLAARLLAREDAPGDAADALLLAFAERLAIVPDDRLAAEAGDWLLRHLAAVPGAGSRWSKLRCDDARPAW